MDKIKLKVMTALICGMFYGTVLYVLFHIAEAAGVVSTKWPATMFAIVWLLWLAYFSILLAGHIQLRIKQLELWYRRRKLDKRIIKQAKTAGVWNTNAGGRALELYAKKCGVKKYEGESDAHLRARIKAALEKFDTSQWTEITMVREEEGR